MSCSSICIPRVFHTVSSQFIKDTFEKTFKYGKVERVDMVNKTDKKGVVYYKVFVHFRSWSSAPEIEDIRKDLDEDRVVREEFMDHFGNTRWWLFSKSRVEKPTHNVKVKEQVKPKVATVSNKHKPQGLSCSLEKVMARLEMMEEKYKKLEEVNVEMKKRIEDLETEILMKKLSSQPDTSGEKVDTQEKKTSVRWGDDCEESDTSDDDSESDTSEDEDSEEE